MPTVEERFTKLEERVTTMDAGLKQHFTEFRAFVVETIDGTEKRLAAELAEANSKLDTLISRVPRRPRARRQPRTPRRT